MSVHRWLLLGFVAASLGGFVLFGLSTGVRAGADDLSDGGVTVCSGGSIAAGIYQNLNIAGACTVDAGSVTVEHNLTVLSGGTLVAVTGGIGAFPSSSDLTIGGNVEVQAGGLLNMGCEPIYYICVNDPDQVVGSYSTHHTIAGNLTADNAFSVLVHHASIGGSVKVTGGGGGTNSCSESIPALEFAPPYGDFEDVAIAGSLTITGWRSCWLGVFRVTVLQGTEWVDDITGDPDGNEMANNTIIGSLNCFGNSPSNQIGDSLGAPSTVLGNATGQCANPAIAVH